MNDILRYEILAETFYLMTGKIAPGKNAPAAAYIESADMKEWDEWLTDNKKTVMSTLIAIKNFDDSGTTMKGFYNDK